MAIKITSFFPQKGEEHKEQFCLQDNGVYWFLYPFFTRLSERTGQMIDLYGPSNFHGDNLLEFDRILVDALKDAEVQPDQWNRKVEIIIKSKKQILIDKVSKNDVLTTINLLKNIVTEAIKNNGIIVFEGL